MIAHARWTATPSVAGAAANSLLGKRGKPGDIVKTNMQRRAVLAIAPIGDDDHEPRADRPGAEIRSPVVGRE